MKRRLILFLTLLMLAGGRPALALFDGACLHEASAQVWADPGPFMRALYQDTALAPVAAYDWDERVGAIARGLSAPANLEKVMKITDLDLRARDEAEFRRLRDELRPHIQISREAGHPHLHTITVRHAEAEVALSAVKALTERFVEEIDKRIREIADRYSGYADRQLKDYEQRLQTVAQRLKAPAGDQEPVKPAVLTNPEPAGEDDAEAALRTVLVREYERLRRRYHALRDRQQAMAAAGREASWIDVTASPAVSACREE